MSSKRKKISRREFLRRSGQVVSGLVSAGALASTGCAIGQERPVLERAKDASANGAICLGRQSTGSDIWQVTTEEFRQSNIYCEIPYCSGDSRHFIYERYNPERTDKNKTELMAVELGTWKQHRLDAAYGITGSAISDDGVFYYLKRTDGETLDLMRADLPNGTPEKIYHIEGERSLISFGTVSADTR